MTDFLDKLIADAERRVAMGYYNVNFEIDHDHLSLVRAIKNCKHNAIIAEIKPKSPTRGALRVRLDPIDAAVQLARGGASGISILTEPENFGGKIETVVQIRQVVDIPLLMKDVILDERQIDAARNSGADCILLMLSALIRKGIPPTKLVEKAHSVQLEAILEVHDGEELEKATETNADIIGINNRNLKNLAIDLNTTIKLLDSVPQPESKTIISESGLETMEDVRRLKRARVDGFLIGSSIMLAPDLTSKVREFVFA